jgi:hypothetical protein
MVQVVVLSFVAEFCVVILSSTSLFRFVFLVVEFFLVVSFCVLAVDDFVLASVLSTERSPAQDKAEQFYNKRTLEFNNI